MEYGIKTLLAGCCHGVLQRCHYLGAKISQSSLVSRQLSSSVWVEKFNRNSSRTEGDHPNPTCSENLDPKIFSITDFVDKLLHQTRALMGKPAILSGESTNEQQQQQQQQHIIAFSGGVDSSLVAALLSQCRVDGEEVRAILGFSPAVPQEQLDLAHTVADTIGVPLQIIQTTEGQDEMYIANSGQACLACKTHLYSSMQAVVDHVSTLHSSDDKRRQQEQQQQQYEHDHHEEHVWQLQHNNEITSQEPFHLYNGTNADDLKDLTRLGLIAAQQFSVRSPLQHITKSQVRLASKHLGLPNWNYAASPCLRSRLALGVPATADRLRRIEQAERHVRHKLRHIMDETANLRVRLLAKNRARIEVDSQFLRHVQNVNWDEKMIHELGFSSVVLQAFKSGSVATRNDSKTP